MNVPAVMKGVQLTGHGGPEKLVWNEAIPVPAPGPGQVLVRVLAAGVNNTDINTRIGWYARESRGATQEDAGASAVAEGGWAGALAFPRVQGGDLCGLVVSSGDTGGRFVPGMRVTCPLNQAEPAPEEPLRTVALGSEYDGAFAQYCLLPADQLHDVTASPLSDVEIAAIPCSHGTALNLLTRAGVGPGDRVLVTGASGGVGLAAVELAALKGASVTAVCDPAKQAAVREAGATAVLPRGATPTPRSHTVVIDIVGGPAWGGLIEALVPGGRYAVAGAIAGPIVEADLRAIYLNDLTLYGCTFTPPQVFAELVGYINSGRVRPLVSKTYPLEEIAQAQADFLAKKYPGKLVLIPPAD